MSLSNICFSSVTVSNSIKQSSSEQSDIELLDLTSLNGFTKFSEKISYHLIFIR
mgnify:CR=1 FL=1